MATISDRIIGLLRDRGMKQRELADACGVAPSTVSNWLRQGTNSIPSDYLKPIADLFEITVEELFSGTRPSPTDVDINSLTDYEKRLIRYYRQAGWEGQQVILSSAITEARRVTDKQG